MHRARFALALAVAALPACSLIFDPDDHVGTAAADAGRDARPLDAPARDAGPRPDGSLEPDAGDGGATDGGSPDPCDRRAAWYRGEPSTRELCPTGALLGPSVMMVAAGTFRPTISVAVPTRTDPADPLVMIGLVGDPASASTVAYLSTTTLGEVVGTPEQFESGPFVPLPDVTSFDLRVEDACRVGWVAEGRRGAPGDSGIHLGHANACLAGMGIETRAVGARASDSDAQPVAAVSSDGADGSIAFWTEVPGPVAVMRGNEATDTITAAPAGLVAPMGRARVAGTIEPRALLDSTATEIAWWTPDADPPFQTIDIGESRGELGFATLDTSEDLDVAAWLPALVDELRLRALGTGTACGDPITDVMIPAAPEAFDVASMPGGGIVVARADGARARIVLTFYDRRLAPVDPLGGGVVEIPLAAFTVVEGLAVDTLRDAGMSVVVVAFVQSTGMARFGYYVLAIPDCG